MSEESGFKSEWIRFRDGSIIMRCMIAAIQPDNDYGCHLHLLSGTKLWVPVNDPIVVWANVADGPESEPDRI